jgi:SAM-dependent methyltransferase
MTELPVDKKTEDVYTDWNSYWKDFNGYTFVGRFLMKQSLAVVKTVLESDGTVIKKDAKIIDIGCGTGRTLAIFRSWGYSNIYGIDNSEESIKLCEQRGFIKNKDVFVMDGMNTTFNDDEFELVFSEGILEHFSDFTGFVNEMARINSKYILLIQPNHFSYFGKILNFLQDCLMHNIKEFSYTVDDFKVSFEDVGYTLKYLKDSPQKDFWILLFEKKQMHTEQKE